VDSDSTKNSFSTEAMSTTTVGSTLESDLVSPTSAPSTAVGASTEKQPEQMEQQKKCAENGEYVSVDNWP
jgi:hypothetical protein